MTLETLNWVRLITPGILIYLLWNSWVWIVRPTDFKLPEKLDEVSGLLLTLIIGGVWYYLGVRDRANREATRKIHQNIVTKMREVISTNPNRVKISWEHVDRLFYYYIDKDSSLKQQAHMAYWNGAFWSFAADLRVASALALGVYVLTMLVGQMDWLSYSPSHWFLALIVDLILLVISIPMTQAATSKQIEIGDRQIRTMILIYKDELQTKLDEMANALP